MYERALRVISPGLAERQYASRVAFETRAMHAAADKDRTTEGWRTISGNPHDNLRVDRTTIAQRARYLAACTSHGTASYTGLLDAVIGTGINIQSRAQFTDPGLLASEISETEVRSQRRRRRQIDDARRAWNEVCNWEERGEWQDLEELGFHEILIPGEAYLRQMIEPEWQRKGMRIPLRYHMIRQEQLTDYTVQPARGNEVYDGIEIDSYGRTVAYHVESDSYRREVIRVPASEMVHAYRQDWPSQRRGLSWYAPVIPEMQNFDEFKQYKQIAAKVQSAIALVVGRDSQNRGGGLPGLSGQDPTTDGNGSPIRAIEPGMIHDIGTGKIHSHTPAPSGDTDVMTRLFLRSIGVGFGLSYEAQSGDYSATNFAGGRMGMLRTRKRVSSIHSFFQRRFEKPVHKKFVEFSLLFDPQFPRAAAGDPAACSFSRPKFDWGVNPYQEVRAAVLRIQKGLSTLENEAGQMGDDWYDFMEQLGVELDVEDALNLDAPVHPVHDNAPEQPIAEDSDLDS